MFKAIITTKPKFLGLVESRTLVISGFKTFKEVCTVADKLRADKSIKEVKVVCN